MTVWTKRKIKRREGTTATKVTAAKLPQPMTRLRSAC